MNFTRNHSFVTRRLSLVIAAAFAAVAANAAVPEVTSVTMTQTPDRLVTIAYTLTDAPAVVTLDIQTNATANAASDDPGWTSIGGEAIWNAMGDVWRKVGEAGGTFNGTITWHPDHSWPDHRIEGDRARAVVTAWATNNTPDYMVVDLAADRTVRYYPASDFLPRKGFDQEGAAVTNNPDYKTTKLLMRKIMARGVEWTMGSGADETQRASNETAHNVTLDHNYYIGVFELTQKQWKMVVTNVTITPTVNVGDLKPMEAASWNAMRHAKGNANITSATYYYPHDPHPESFLGLLRLKTGIDFDMPSEAEWEYAARAGHGSGEWGDGSIILNADTDANLARLGHYLYNGPARKTVDVGLYAPNDWGLYDVFGNASEMCLDVATSDITGLNGAVACGTTELGIYRRRKGGNGGKVAGVCRPAYRDAYYQPYNPDGQTIRLCCRAGLD